MKKLNNNEIGIVSGGWKCECISLAELNGIIPPPGYSLAYAYLGEITPAECVIECGKRGLQWQLRNS